MISFSVAFDPNKGIGYKNVMPWHIKEEFKVFRRNTMNKNIVMGQTTYDNLPGKLENRIITVVSIDPEYHREGVEVTNDLIAFLKEHQFDETEYIICGGASIYRQAYPYAHKAYVSFIKKEYEVDTYLDVFEMDDWNILNEEEHDEFIYRELIRNVDLEDDEILLRHINMDDCEAIYNNWASDPEVSKYVMWNTHESIETTKAIMNLWLEQYRRGNIYRYGIELKDCHELIGMIDVVNIKDGCPEIGYNLSRKYWNQGYMTRALKLLCDRLFEDGFKTIIIEAVKDNIGSNRVIEKNGFEFTGTRQMIHKGIEVTVNSYRKTK